jgi:hypothetical protein
VPAAILTQLIRLIHELIQSYSFIGVQLYSSRPQVDDAIPTRVDVYA